MSEKTVALSGRERRLMAELLKVLVEVADAESVSGADVVDRLTILRHERGVNVESLLAKLEGRR